MSDTFTELRELFNTETTDCIQAFLNSIDINQRDEKGNTLLHYAVHQNHHAITRLLVDQPGIECNIQNLWKYTPLHLAAQSSQVEAVRLLLNHFPFTSSASPVESRIAINIEDTFGCTALHCAIQAGCPEIVNMLVEHPSADVNTKGKLSCTPLYYAAATQHKEITKILLKHGADTEEAKPLLVEWFISTQDQIFRTYLLLAGLSIQPEDEDIASIINKEKLESIHQCLTSVTAILEQIFQATIEPHVIIKLLRLPYSYILKLIKDLKQSHPFEKQQVLSQKNLKDHASDYLQLIRHSKKTFGWNRNIFVGLARNKKHSAEIMYQIAAWTHDNESIHSLSEQLAIPFQLTDSLYFGLQNEHSPVSRLYQERFKESTIETILSKGPIP